ncbi:MAG: tRNA pseudouridine(13) synthase TruD [Gammaproteobacteria bacterium]|nr:tRNA pseudouridine(13) synthase TruD [Gammaproteobacteria bacterium]
MSDQYAGAIAAVEPGELPRAWGGSAGHASLRVSPEDFQVDELLGFEPAGEGEHVLLRIRKRNLTTWDTARRIAQATGARHSDVGYCGMKDRNALTTQWFSVLLTARPEPDWTGLDSAQTVLLSHIRHTRKLRPGSHAGNRFVLLLRNVEASSAGLEQRLRAIQYAGFPNYFGVQRFGSRGDNAVRAQAMLAGKLRVSRHERGILLSALRAALFNRVLAQRVADNTWNTAQESDVLMLAGTHSVFAVDVDDEAVHARLIDGDVHITGPLCGRARDGLGELLGEEQAILAPFVADLSALAKAGVKAQRRALRAIPRDLRWRWHDTQQLELSFTLEPGAFATSLVRELVADGGQTQCP